MGDALADLYAVCPRLRDSSHRITSQPTDSYNCVAWVKRDIRRWWQPEFYWPDEVPKPDPWDDEDLWAYVALFEWMGFERCENGALEQGFLKIVIYANGDEFQHVAKQLPSGAWSSKMGELHDLRHDHVEALSGAGLLKSAMPRHYMKRPYDGMDPMQIEETGLLLF